MLTKESVFSIVNNSIARTKRDKTQRLFERIKAFAAGDVERMVQYIPLNARETGSEFASKPKAVSLVTKDILTRYMNGVSALPVTRLLKDGTEFDFSYFEKNLNLSKIQMMVEVAGTVLVRPVLNAEGEMDYEVYLPHEFTPIVNSKTGKLNELILHYGETVEHWTRDSVRIWLNGEELTNSLNPYNRIPFSVFKAGERVGDFWGASDLEGVSNENNHINKSLTDLLTLATDQSFSIFVLEGFDPTEVEDDGSNEANPNGNPVRIDTSGIMTLPGGAKLNTVTPEASIQELTEYINNELARIRKEAGVVDVEDNQYSSGFALRVRKGSYLEKMEAKRRLFAQADSRLMELAVLVYEVAKTGQERFLNPSFQVQTLFDTSSLTPMSPDEKREQIERDRFQLEIGALNPIEVIARDRNISMEEAEEIYKNNLTMNAMISGGSDGNQ